MKVQATVFSAVLALCAALAAARPGLWYKQDGTQIVGGSSFKCSKLYLGLYGAERVSCKECVCASTGEDGVGLDRVVVAKHGTTQIRFDHTLGSVDVDGVRIAIPGSVDRRGCEPDVVKALRFRCNGEAELVFKDPDMSYVCQKSKGQNNCSR